MAAKRSSSICWTCQARQIAFGRRRLSTTGRRRLETVALRPEDDGFIFSNSKDSAKKQEQGDGPVLSMTDTMKQWKLHSPVDDLREALLGFEALYKRRDMRIEVLRNLSNPWPEFQEQKHNERLIPKEQRLVPPEANAAPIPHTAFRKNIKAAIGSKAIRQVLRAQLLRCEWPKEVLRVMAVAMQNKITAHHFSIIHEPIMRALYRCRRNVSDPQVLSALTAIVTRLQLAGVEVAPQLLQMALKFAARARSLPSMKRFLREYRVRDLHMTSNVFRSIIAKFSIGHRGLGEIRNGRWQRDQLMQVLTGFEDAAHLPPDQQYHLGTFLDRNDWQYLHGWVAVLSRCRDGEGVWREWELWKRSEARTRPKALASMNPNMTSKVRGDYWFMEQMAYSGDIEKAWQLMKETGLDFTTLHDRVKTKLMDGIEHATIWNDDVRNEMLRKYDSELAKIERAFGVTWQAGMEEGEGTHVLVGSQEDALDALGADDWKPEEDFGFPYDSSPIVPEQERDLHDAEEKGLASDSDRSR